MHINHHHNKYSMSVVDFGSTYCFSPLFSLDCETQCSGHALGHLKSSRTEGLRMSLLYACNGGKQRNSP